MRILFSAAVAICALLFGLPAGAQESKPYVIGEENVVVGEAFCKDKASIKKVAAAFAKSSEEGLKVERETCTVPGRVFVIMGQPVVHLFQITVTLIRVVETVKPPDDKRRVTFIEVTAGHGTTFFMTTYQEVPQPREPL